MNFGRASTPIEQPSVDTTENAAESSMEGEDEFGGEDFYTGPSLKLNYVKDEILQKPQFDEERFQQ